MSSFLKTLKIRVKDKHASVLGQMAREVNTVWNFVNELSQRAISEKAKFMSGYDLQKYTAGYCKCEGVLVGSDQHWLDSRDRLSCGIAPNGSSGSLWWNPLRSDGEALRLAVKLNMDVDTSHPDTVFAGDLDVMCTESKGDDPAAATRRAIVRAAASIGRASPAVGGGGNG